MPILCNNQVLRLKAYSPADLKLLIAPTSPRTIRKMADAVNYQEVHDLLIEIAHQAGEMITSANPLVSTTSTKASCESPLRL